MQVGDALHRLLERMGGRPVKSRLSDLWENWSEVMGLELASLMCNYGNHEELLILCAENSLQLQNLQFMAEEARARANAYLGSEYFTSVRVSLYGADKKRSRREVRPVAAPQGRTGPQSAAIGKFLEEMDMRSPVARCYSVFAGRRK